MKTPDQNDLLKEILADDSLAAMREQSLNQGLAALRGRNRRRRARRMGAMVAVPALVIAAILVFNRAPENAKVAEVNPVAKTITPLTIPTTAPAVTPSAAVATEAATSDAPQPLAKEMSDEELLALFPGRAVALIGPPGRQQLVFFDKDGKF
jgi:hypothetical protein